MSWCCTASIVRSSAATTRSSPPSARSSSSRSSCLKCARDSPMTRLLAELAGDVLLGAGVARVREDLLGLVELDQLAGEHERGPVGDARGLLHVVRDDHDRVALLELVDQLLDLERRDRVERRARLVHQDHLGLDRQRARDAQPLLLTAREADAPLGEAAPDLPPPARPPARPPAAPAAPRPPP